MTNTITITLRDTTNGQGHSYLARRVTELCSTEGLAVDAVFGDYGSRETQIRALEIQGLDYDEAEHLYEAAVAASQEAWVEYAGGEED